MILLPHFPNARITGLPTHLAVDFDYNLQLYTSDAANICPFPCSCLSCADQLLWPNFTTFYLEDWLETTRSLASPRLIPAIQELLAPHCHRPFNSTFLTDSISSTVWKLLTFFFKHDTASPSSKCPKNTVYHYSGDLIFQSLLLLQDAFLERYSPQKVLFPAWLLWDFWWFK